MQNRNRSQGFSVVELLVAMGISLVLLAGVVTLFANSRRSYESNDHLAKIQENGRFALDTIMRDLRTAGYAGCAKGVPFNNTLNSNTTLPWNFSQSVAGFQSTGAAWTPTIDALVQSPAAVNSDVLVVRSPDPDAATQYLASDLAGGTDDVTITPPVSYAAGDVLLISDCNAASVFEISAYSNATGTISHAAGAGVANKSPGNATADLGYAYLAGAAIIPMRTTIYYVRQSSDPTHGNSLWRRVGIGTPEELVEGVDSLQVLYGRDTNGDRVVDDYVTANSVTNWDTVVSVRVGLLVRSVDQYANNPDVNHTVLDQAIGAATDQRERLVFTSTATLRNKAL